MSKKQPAEKKAIDPKKLYVEKLSKPRKWIRMAQNTLTDLYKNYVKRWKMVPIEDRMNLTHITEEELISIKLNIGLLPFLFNTIGEEVVSIKLQIAEMIPALIEDHLQLKRSKDELEIESFEANLQIIEAVEMRLEKLKQVI